MSNKGEPDFVKGLMETMQRNYTTEMSNLIKLGVAKAKRAHIKARIND
jgi:predicted transcriptional regulator with HTH domain